MQDNDPKYKFYITCDEVECDFLLVHDWQLCLRERAKKYNKGRCGEM